MSKPQSKLQGLNSKIARTETKETEKQYSNTQGLK